MMPLARHIANVPASRPRRPRTEVPRKEMPWPGPARSGWPPSRPTTPTCATWPLPDGDDRVVRLPDPAPDVPDPLPGQWWPPVMLQTGWVAEHHREFDLAHLHFGFDAATPADLRRWTAELAGRGPAAGADRARPDQSAFRGPARHREQLDVLIPAADELITLTTGRGRGHRATVGTPGQRHPASACRPPRRTAAASGRRPPAALVHRSCTPRACGPTSIRSRCCSRSMSRRRTARTRRPGGSAPGRAAAAAMTDRARLREWLSSKEDDRRWQDPGAPDVHRRRAVGLPRRDSICTCCRTGSAPIPGGWRPAWTSAPAVLVPDVGCYAEQHGHPRYPRSADGAIDQPAFAELLGRAARRPVVATPPPPGSARAQRRRIAAAHEAIYRSALDARRLTASAGCVAGITPRPAWFDRQCASLGYGPLTSGGRSRPDLPEHHRGSIAKESEASRT